MSVVLGAAVAGCSGSSMDDDRSDLAIGLVVPLSGPYQAIGVDMRRGWDLYLSEHGGKLGGRRVRVVTVDEGDGAATARAGVDRLLKAEKVSAVVGTADAQAVSTIAPVTTAARVPFVGTGGRPSTVDDARYTWHTSFLSRDYGKAIGPYLAKHLTGPTYVIGPNSQGGKDQIGGFVDAYTAAGGRLANADGQPAWVPWPSTTNFGPWITAAREADPAAIYTFYAGAPGVTFAKQYAQFGAKPTPLYAPAFLTEGGALAAEGAAADGIYTVANYAPGLDNPTNKRFAAAITAKYQVAPTIYHVTSYDAAALLDQALQDAGTKPTPDAINAAIGRVKRIDSPRGEWTFAPATHSPIQSWYLRQVKEVGGQRANVVVDQLGTVGG